MQTLRMNNIQKIIMRLYQNLPREIYIHQHNTAKNACTLFQMLCEEQIYQKETAQLSPMGIRLGALYHDSGKILIPKEILCKKEPLTQKERSMIFWHAQYGGDIAISLLKRAHHKYQKTVWDMAQYHHERWDGMGYPNGLKGQEIPVAARICSIADSYDAMVSRPYNKDLSKEHACREIEKNAGSQFDPILSELFLLYVQEKRVLSTF